MRRHRPLRSWPFPRPSRLEPAPVWRRFAAGTIDVALDFGYRLIADHVTAREMDPKTAALKQAQERDETLAFSEVNTEFLEALGTTKPWSPEKALDMLVWRLMRLAPMIWTDGQTAGECCSACAWCA